MNKALGIAGLIILVIIVVAIKMHGNARYAEGEKSCKATQATTAVTQTNESSEQLKKAMNDAEKLPTDDLDRAGSALGILRREDDY